MKKKGIFGLDHLNYNFILIYNCLTLILIGGFCGSLNENCPLQTPIFEYLVPRWWHCLQRWRLARIVSQDGL